MAKKKNKGKNYWNFRIITKLKKYTIGEEDEESYRSFSIAEVHYENGHPVSYGNKNNLKNFENVESLLWTHKKIKKAFKKPVLDADNCLQIFVSEPGLIDPSTNE